VIYFRVLKLGHKSALLPITLKGLAKFSHLINIDFFGDLMNCLEGILKYEVRIQFWVFLFNAIREINKQEGLQKELYWED